MMKLLLSIRTILKPVNAEIYRLTVEMNIQDGFIRNTIRIKIYPNLQKQKTV